MDFGRVFRVIFKLSVTLYIHCLVALHEGAFTLHFAGLCFTNEIHESAAKIKTTNIYCMMEIDRVGDHEKFGALSIGLMIS